MPFPSTTIQVSEAVRKQLAEVGARRQAQLGRSGRIPYSEVIEYLLEHYHQTQRAAARPTVDKSP